MIPLIHFCARSVCSLILGLIFAGHSALAADSANPMPAPSRVVVPKLSGKIAVDGELSESVWLKAAVLKPFFRNNGSGRENESTEVRIWHDNKALYLGWVCRDADIMATFTNRDSMFWEEEVAEFFFTTGKMEEYFELQWNPLGGVFDAIIHNKLDAQGFSKGITGDWSYTASGMKSAVKMKGTSMKSDDRDEMWKVEVIVPFADLKTAAPKRGDVWRANFYRFNRAQGKPPELLSWSPTLKPSFHEPSRFGYLEFGK